MRRRSVLQAAGIASSGFLAGCLGGNGDDTEDEEFRIGAPFPYTGPYSDQADQGFEAVEIAASTLREDPEFDYSVRTFTGDTELSPSRAVEIVRRMIEENNINLITGTVSSSSGQAISPLSKENKILMTTPNNALFHFAEDCHKYKFPVGKPSQDLIRYTAPMVYQEDLGTRWYSITADYAFGHDLAAQTEETASETDGYEFVGESVVPFGHGDYSQIFEQARSADADVVWLNNFGVDTTTSASQAIARGIHEEMNVIIPQGNYISMDQLPEEGRQQLYAGLAWFHRADYDSTREFTEKFEQQMGRPPLMMNGLFYKLVMLPAAGIKEVGLNSDDVSEWLSGRELTINAGPEKIRECDHYPVGTNFVVRGKSPDEQEGRWDLFEPIDIGGSGPPGSVTPDDVEPRECSSECGL